MAAQGSVHRGEEDTGGEARSKANCTRARFLDPARLDQCLDGEGFALFGETARRELFCVTIERFEHRSRVAASAGRACALDERPLHAEVHVLSCNVSYVRWRGR